MAPVTKIVLIIEDNATNCRMFSTAIAESGAPVDVRRVKNFTSLLAYLTHQGEYEDAKLHPSPGLILLDIDSDREAGLDVLRKIKLHPELKRIPVVTLTSGNEEDVSDFYELGANSYVVKPATSAEFAASFKTIYRYWFENVELPTVR
jgi:CheY-like chemotaxis protein